MTIAVFGSTGFTGGKIVELALAEGFEVKALVRDPQKIPSTRNQLEVIVGDARNRSDVAKVVKGADAVLSALGTDHLGATTIYSESITHIISCMEEAGVKRLLCVGAVGQDPERSANMPIIGKLFINLVLKKTLEDMYKMQRALEASDLHWTLVLPPRLSNGPMTGEYRLANDQALKKGRVISRADVAHFMVGNIDNLDYSCTRTAIAY